MSTIKKAGVGLGSVLLLSLVACGDIDMLNVAGENEMNPTAQKDLLQLSKEAGDGVTTIVATTEHGWLHFGTISNPKEQLQIRVYLAERDSNKLVFHTQTAEATYELSISLWSNIKYEKLIYEKATIAVDGDVTYARHDANPEECCNNEKSGPGRTFLSVSATTKEDERTPPREVRPYKITLHLTGLKAISRADKTVDLGNYDIVYNLQFVFFHNLGSFPGNSAQRLKRCGDELTCGGGPGRETHFFHRKSTGAEQVEGPTPILESEDGINIIIPEGEDLFKVEPFDFPFSLPADFFGPGSEPFVGNIILGGTGDGTADTTIRRLEPIEFEGYLPRTDTIPIEIVALNLVSVEPVTITFDDGSSQQWDIQITLSDETPSTGEMTITETFERGGTFDSFFDVRAEVKFQPTFGEIFLPTYPIRSDTIFTDPILTNPIDEGGRNVVAPIAVDVFPMGLKAKDIPWEICDGTDSDFCPPGQITIGVVEDETEPVGADLAVIKVEEASPHCERLPVDWSYENHGTECVERGEHNITIWNSGGTVVKQDSFPTVRLCPGESSRTGNFYDVQPTGYYHPYTVKVCSSSIQPPESHPQDDCLQVELRASCDPDLTVNGLAHPVFFVGSETAVTVSVENHGQVSSTSQQGMVNLYGPTGPPESQASFATEINIGAGSVVNLSTPVRLTATSPGGHTILACAQSVVPPEDLSHDDNCRRFPIMVLTE